jgi:hypothetical protein
MRATCSSRPLGAARPARRGQVIARAGPLLSRRRLAGLGGALALAGFLGSRNPFAESDVVRAAGGAMKAYSPCRAGQAWRRPWQEPTGPAPLLQAVAAPAVIEAPAPPADKEADASAEGPSPWFTGLLGAGASAAYFFQQLQNQVGTRATSWAPEQMGTACVTYLPLSISAEGRPGWSTGQGHSGGPRARRAAVGARHLSSRPSC